MGEWTMAQWHDQKALAETREKAEKARFLAEDLLSLDGVFYPVVRIFRYSDQDEIHFRPATSAESWTEDDSVRMFFDGDRIVIENMGDEARLVELSLRNKQTKVIHKGDRLVWSTDHRGNLMTLSD